MKITEWIVKVHPTSVYEKTKPGNCLNLALLINRGVSKIIRYRQRPATA